MEALAATIYVHGADTQCGREAEKLLEPLDGANRRYLRKRNTPRLIQLLRNSFWTNPHRSALIFEVLHQRASHNAIRAAANRRPVWPTPSQVSARVAT